MDGLLEQLVIPKAANTIILNSYPENKSLAIKTLYIKEEDNDNVWEGWTSWT